eukprot:GHVS01085308.1.p1 GENE.GHVS01085308.1~~GHVS01085308.1.p1  ORF type:complete len:475 (+),score=100.68 GHVS01085308.1:81-1505(+)
MRLLRTQLVVTTLLLYNTTNNNNAEEEDDPIVPTTTTATDNMSSPLLLLSTTTTTTTTTLSSTTTTDTGAGDPVAADKLPATKQQPSADNLITRTLTTTRTLTVPLTNDNLAALLVLGGFCMMGCLYLHRCVLNYATLRCSCKLCKQEYICLHQLGSGGYGTVWLVSCRLTDMQTAAAQKRTKKSSPKNSQAEEDTNLFVLKKIPIEEVTETDDYTAEAKRLNLLHHKHVVGYREDFVHREGSSNRLFMMLITEYCRSGDLKDLIDRGNNEMSEYKIREVLKQLLQAVSYLHDRNIIHRDIKTQNVFLGADGSVRLGDFGLCKLTTKRRKGGSQLLHDKTQDAAKLRQSHAGTDCYMAPEMINSSSYGKPADMWCVGCVLVEMCSGVYLWELDLVLGLKVEESGGAVVQDLITRYFHPTITANLRSFTRRLLQNDPSLRPTAASLLKKRYFKKNFPVESRTFAELEQKTNTSIS